MRALRRLARPAVATAAAVLVLSGCGGDDSDSGSSSSSSSSSSSTSAGSSSSGTSGSPGSADPAVAAFCEDAAVFAEVGDELQSASPEQLSPLLQEAAAAFSAVEPPAEIAGDWEFVGAALQRFADAAADVDPATPEGEAALQGPAQEFVTAVSGPEGTNVQQYVTTNCPGVG